MNFFRAQDDARRKTLYLLFLFVLAIIALVVLTNLFVMGIIAWGGIGGGVYTDPAHRFDLHSFWQYFDWQRFGIIGAGVVLVIFVASLYKSWAIGKGGRSVAESMGGRLVLMDNATAAERRLLNIVDEMAIASGTPVPLVYVMHNEAGINAFAAGLNSSDAVIAVTQGILDQLSRDELQGVIAHEFSHIIHGDMRLNMRLVGVLFGILMIGLVGRFMLRSAFYRSYGYRSRSSKDNNPLVLIGIGVGFIILGYTGVFFGNMIKAAISRQREFLADASAVRYTRNPDGIADALKRIGSYAGSELNHPGAAQFSHAYFSNGIKQSFLSVLATHPPLEQRILKIQPSWDGKFDLKAINVADTEKLPEKTNTPSANAKLVAATVLANDVVQSIDKMGELGPAQIELAQNTLASIPDSLLDIARSPFGARALVYAMLLRSGKRNAKEKVQFLRNKADPGVLAMLNTALQQLKLLSPDKRLPLLEIAIPALRQLSKQQYLLFKSNMQHIVLLAEEDNAFQWALEQIVLFHLQTEFENKKPKMARYGSLSALRREVNVLLSYLAATNNDDAAEKQAFTAANAYLPGLILEAVDADMSDFSSLGLALSQLSLLKPLLKPQLLKACVAVIASDNKITLDEMDLLRLFSTLLDCPMPLLPNIKAGYE